MAGSEIKRNLIIALTAVTLCSGISCATPRERAKVRQERTTATQKRAAGILGFDVRDIVEKPDDNLVRICGNLTGEPSTSCRIDSVTLTAGDRSVEADDIDGVDFKRYFIWEDEGIIYLELDFPGYDTAKKLLAGPLECKLIFHTVKGDVPVTIANGKHK